MQLKVTIQGADGVTFSDMFQEPLNFGRQRGHDEPMFVRCHGEDGFRVAIASREDIKTASRRQLRLEPVSNCVVRIINQSSHIPIYVDEVLRLQAQGVVERAVPFQVRIGSTTIRVESSQQPAELVEELNSASQDSEALSSAIFHSLREGDQRIASLVVSRFEKRLLALARSRLNKVIRQHVDPEDVVQSVFRSFFGRQADGDFELRGWHDLWSLLTVITLRKCGHRAEYFFAACRDVRLQVSLPINEDSYAAFEAIAHEPTPAQAAMFEEAVREMFAEFPGRVRPILEMRLSGAATNDISVSLGCTERHVQRVLKTVRDWLVRRLRSEPGT